MTKSLLIINQHFSTGGIKKSLETLLPELMKRYNVNVILLSGHTKEFDEKYPGIRRESPFLISSALSSLEEICEMRNGSIRVIIKVAFFALSKIFGGERIVKLIIAISRMQGNYDCVISYAHDNWMENGGFFGGGNRFAEKKTVSKNKIAWVHGEPSTIGMTKERIIKAYKNFNHIVAVSNAVKGQLECLSDGQISCECIYNLINIDEVLTKTKGVDYVEGSEYFRIVTVGRLSRVAKRIDKVNEIARMLLNHGYKFKWTVVGSGSEYGLCVDTCRKYGLEDYVSYVGNQENPYQYMKSSDLLVHVSDTEAMSLVLSESLMVGTPVITTNFPAAKESISHGVTGFVVDKDEESLFEAVAYCIDNKALLETMRNNILSQLFDNDASINRIIKIIG